MTGQGNDFTGFAAEQDRSGDRGRPRTARALFAAGLVLVAVNSALYFFGVETLSHPMLSIVGLALLVPQYLRER
jgi:hypothetical protein